MSEVICGLEEFVRRAQLAVYIFATESLSDFSLVNAREFRLDPAFPHFLGVAGIVDGRITSALTEPLAPATLRVLSRSVGDYLAARLIEHLPPEVGVANDTLTH